ncbi:MAG: nicotinate (nicotinamide) nucleotide adenylyltransferase [Bacteroidales bacterium]|nr:nicotinate (nicotinamide) nucleotide adenylyltransferase [Bacteroidales bacterium]
MATLLYFGSFNPVHYGHLSIVQYLCTHPEVDEVRLVLSPKNPLKKAEDLSDASKRLKELQAALDLAQKQNFFQSDKTIRISTVEFDLPQPLYTLKTLRHLKACEPNKDFILLIGGDNITLLEKWHQYDQLLQEFRVWVYPRKDVGAESITCQELAQRHQAKELRFLSEAPLLPISSTLIRAGLAQQWSNDLCGLDATAK